MYNSYPEQTDSCKWFASEFLSTCGSSENNGQAPVTFTLYLYDTLTTANPVPVAVMFTVRVRLGSYREKIVVLYRLKGHLNLNFNIYI